MTRMILTSLAVAVMLGAATPIPASADGKEVRKDITVEVYDQAHDTSPKGSRTGDSTAPPSASVIEGGQNLRSHRPPSSAPRATGDIVIKGKKIGEN
jgi:hypothetical protein